MKHPHEAPRIMPVENSENPEESRPRLKLCLATKVLRDSTRFLKKERAILLMRNSKVAEEGSRCLVSRSEDRSVPRGQIYLISETDSSNVICDSRRAELAPVLNYAKCIFY